MKNRLPDLIHTYQTKNRKSDGTQYSQTEIAVMAGVNPATLSRYINGHSDSYNISVIEKLAEFFGIKQVNEILYFEGED